MPIQIPQYETQHQANPPMAPTLTYAPGEQLGRAVAGFGESVSGFAANMMKVQDRNGKLEAAKILSQAEVEVQEQLMQAGDQLGQSNPEGFAGEFNKTFDKQREVKMREAEKSSKNPYVGRYLKEGFDNLQRNTFLSAMKVERDASHKYGQQQASEFVSAKAKMAMMKPESAADLMRNSAEFIAAMDNMPAAWREEMTAKASAAISESAAMSLIKSDPVTAATVLADKENPITAAMSAETYSRLAPAAQNASIDFQGRTNGRALAAEAFQSKNPLLIQKAIEKIKDQDLRDRTEKYAQAEYNGMVSQQNQIDTMHKKNEYDVATQAAIDGVPYKPTGNISSMYEQQQVVEYYNRLREQMLYQKDGGALSDDLDYVVEVQAMLYAGDKSAILSHPLDRTRLSAGTFKTFSGAIARISGDRNTKVSDVGPYIDRAMVTAGMTTEADKKRASVYKMVFLDRVAQLEAEKGRPLQESEFRQLATDVMSQRYSKEYLGGLHTSSRPSAKAVPAAAQAKISSALRETTIPADFETIRLIHEEMYSDPVRKTVRSILLEENPDAPITDAMIDDRFLMEYAAQYRRK